MSLIDELRDDDDSVRFWAARRAAEDGGAELIDTLLDMALHDFGEVQTGFGMADYHQQVSDAAASALTEVLGRRDGLDERIRAVAFDLTEDDQRVAKVLYHLGTRYEPVRRDLAASSDDRLRLRALKAVLRRTGELTRWGLADPSPAVRVEAIEGATGVTLADLERMLTDVDRQVRRAAAKALQNVPDSEAYVAAARVETDPKVREAFLVGLTSRRAGDVQAALVGYLADGGYVQARAADRLARADDPGVGAAIASRILVHPDERDLPVLVAYEHLLRYAPELRDMLGHLHRHTPYDHLRRKLAQALEADPLVGPDDDPVDGLGRAQQFQLLREVLRWALTALEPAAPDRRAAGAAADDPEDPLDGLRVWLAAPDDDTANRWVTELDWFGSGVAAECLHAAVTGDLRRAMAAGVRAAQEAARREPAAGWERLGADAGVARAAGLTRLVHLCTARQIRAGLDPLPPGPLSPMLLHGPDALRVGMPYQSPSPALQMRRPYALRFIARPKSAVLRPACPDCATPLRVDGAVEWLYHDDDRLAESEDGYAGVLDGSCPACGTAVRARVRLSVTRDRGTDSGELTWDGVEMTGGGHA